MAESKSPPWWRKPVLRQLLSALLPVVVLAATGMAAINKDWAKLYWYTIAGSAVLVNGILVFLKERETKILREEAVEAKTALAMALSGAGQPIIAALASANAADTVEQSRAAVKVLTNRTVAVAREECGRHGDKACRTRAVVRI